MDKVCGLKMVVCMAGAERGGRRDKLLSAHERKEEGTPATTPLFLPFFYFLQANARIAIGQKNFCVNQLLQ